MKRFRDLFRNKDCIKIPSYQRAYAWEEKQLSQFVLDLQQIQGKSYYYGHFILEKNDNGYEVIDGQQRLTTFILFLIVCKHYKSDNSAYRFINQFETVDYDSDVFKAIASYSIDEINERTEFHTSSASKMFEALKYFIKIFKSKKLNESSIDEYIKTFTEAHISVHITHDKAVAVQIFELQNTRGVTLNLIEKVKSKLMKAIYLAKEDKADKKIVDIQIAFAKIYQYEEEINSASFKGDFSLDEILLYQLRMVDDGSKLSSKDKNAFHTPSTSGNREDEVLKYIDDKIKNSENAVNYITNLVERFVITVEFVCNELPRLDAKNHLIGDVLICEKTISIQLFILVRHRFEETFQLFFKRPVLLLMWERLLYTRDFHDKYYRQWYRDNFEQLYLEVASKESPDQVKKTFLIATLNMVSGLS